MIKQSFYFLRSKPSLRRIDGYHLGVRIIAKLSNVCSYCSSSIKDNNFGNAFRDKHVEIRSCLCILFIDGDTIEAKIVHTWRGKFKILADGHGAKYTDRIVDASDVIRCIL